MIDGKPARQKTYPTAMTKYNIGYVSENRKTEGLILSHTVLFNVSITIWRQHCGVVRLDPRAPKNERLSRNTLTSSISRHLAGCSW